MKYNISFLSIYTLLFIPLVIMSCTKEYNRNAIGYSDKYRPNHSFIRTDIFYQDWDIPIDEFKKILNTPDTCFGKFDCPPLAIIGKDTVQYECRRYVTN